MKSLLNVILILLVVNIKSQVNSYNYLLLSLDKIASDGEEKVKKVYANSDGSFFMCGTMTDTLQFGNQVAYMKCHGTTDFFVAYFKANQQCVWVKTFGGNNSDVAFSCCADNNKNVYVVGGYSSDSIILGTSIFYNTHQGYSDLFIIKLDSTGNFLWAKSNTGIGFENQRIVACITDKENNLIVVGDHDGLFIWEDDTLADFNYPNTLSRDGFVAKFNADGNKLWIKHIYSYGHDEITSCTVDNSNNIYITGHFSYYYMDIDTIRINNCSSLFNGFIAKLTPQGVCLWAKRIDNVSSPSFCKFFKNNEIFWSNTMKGNAQLDTILFQNSATSPANFVLIKI
ncbi:MAG: hypothetical protein N2449_00465, partial [Bacteroidales bacterium]|nr:hypothetical protein [Bacteroidales bacterium]